LYYYNYYYYCYPVKVIPVIGYLHTVGWVVPPSRAAMAVDDPRKAEACGARDS
jgi:hypothetical protein